MAYFKTGVAANHIDLFNILLNFLTSELPTEERWEMIRHTGVTDIQSSSFVVSYEPWTAFKGPYHEHANGWRTAITQHLNSWLSWKMVSPLNISRLRLRGSPTASESPRDFRLEWSDDGIAWNTRQSWTGVTWGSSELKELAITNSSPGAKSYWRIFVTNNNGSTNYTRIDEVIIPEYILSSDFDHSRRPAAWLRAPGLTGLDPVYVNFQIYDRPTSDYYNLAFTGATGFVGASNFDDQPGALAAKAIPLWDSSIPYWISGNGQRVVIAARVDTVYVSAYVGKMMTFGLPGQFPYPLVVAGSLSTAAAVRYSDASVACPFKGNSTRMQLRSTDGTWKIPHAWPYTQVSGSPKTYRDTNGNYPLLPITLHDSSNTYGVLDGVKFITGFNNAAENTLAIGPEEWVCLQDGPRNGLGDFYSQRIL